ncbi:LytTR family transcriptional regulator DNA-binding domain-containing protein, partial [bacterium]|nr:LytTR family transcriptional regulator DNA-binding domain-containing protein [bacterium]
GLSDHPYWIKIDLNSEKSILKEKWILELATFKLATADIHYKKLNGEWFHQKAGLHIPKGQQEVKGRNFVFLITDMDFSEPLLIKAEGRYLRIPIHVWSVQGFFDKEQRQVVLDGVFYGIVFAIICYHLFMFLALRSRSYLYYAFFLCVVLFLFLAGQGWVFFLLFSKLPLAFADFSIILSPFLGWLLLIIGIQFTRTYLRLADYAQILDRILTAFLWFLTTVGAAGVVLLLLRLINIFAGLYNFGFVLIVLVIALCFFAAIKGFQQGQITARYYLIATSLQFLVSIIMILSMFELIPFSFRWEILQWSSVVEMMIFSFGLSKQVEQLNLEKERINTELLSSREENIKQLETINSLKDRILSNVLDSRLYPEFARLFPVLNKVIYIQAISNSSRVVFLDEGMENEIEIQASLKDIETYFDTEHFTRIHKSYLVKQGLKYTFQRRSSADYDMVTRHFVLPVGRKYMKFLKK